MDFQTQMMRQAIELARRGVESTPPNPQVGCVICQDKTVVGLGWHERAGGPHAEVVALRQAGERARGASVFVNLEPCSHVGLTGPCAQALIAAAVNEVYVACRDPNPVVDGGGLEQLRLAGINVHVGLLEAEARRLNAGFMSRFERGRPRVRLKLAASMDGRTATHTGHSQWITGAAARADVQSLRARAGAVLTGIGTVLADNPRLNVRRAEFERQPLRVVVDSSLRTPVNAPLITVPGRVLVAVAEPGRGSEGEFSNIDNVTVVHLPDRDGRIDLNALMFVLAAEKVNDVLVECGPVLAGALMRQRLVDDAVIYIAPKIVGNTGLPMFDLPSITRMDQALGGEITEVTKIGSDIRVDLCFGHSETEGYTTDVHRNH